MKGYVDDAPLTVWLRNQRLQRLGGGVVERWSKAALSMAQLFALGTHKDREAVRCVRRVCRDRKTLITAHEAFLLYSMARVQSARPGAMAEVGVYHGGSAKVLCEVKGTRPLHLFDTFEGLPKPSEADAGVFREKQYAASLDAARTYLDAYQNVFFHKGLFPHTLDPEVRAATFSFVHLDADLYQSTLEGLRFFYPRMEASGIIVSHDYSVLAGVRRAFQEFLADKSERPIELTTTQCMLIKR